MILVELVGIEPTTSSMPWRTSLARNALSGLQKHNTSVSKKSGACRLVSVCLTKKPSGDIGRPAATQGTRSAVGRMLPTSLWRQGWQRLDSAESLRSSLHRSGIPFRLASGHGQVREARRLSLQFSRPARPCCNTMRHARDCDEAAGAQFDKPHFEGLSPRRRESEGTVLHGGLQ